MSFGDFCKTPTIDHMGVEVALDALDRRLEREGARRLTLAERLELEAAIAAGQPSHLTHRQVRQRVDTLARSILDATAHTLVQELARLVQIEAARGEMSVQDYTLAALRAALYDSTTELALRAEVERLHVTLRAFAQGTGGAAPPAVPAPPAPRAGDQRKGW